MLLLIVASNNNVPEDRIFSLIRSRITIVSLSEYPTIVKNAATVPSVISYPVREKIPNVEKLVKHDYERNKSPVSKESKSHFRNITINIKCRKEIS